MTNENERFDALLNAMVKKPPLDVADREPPADADDKREAEGEV